MFGGYYGITNDNHHRYVRQTTPQNHRLPGGRRRGGRGQVTAIDTQEAEELADTLHSIVDSGELTQSQEKTLNISKWIIERAYGDGEEEDDGE